MAAKYFQEYVKGKMNSSTVPIHFTKKESDDTSITINTKDNMNSENLTTSDISIASDIISSSPTEYEKMIPVPSSTNSSPGMKPRWSTNISDVRKNLNKTIEDGFSISNKLMKDKKDKESILEEADQNNIRSSATMPNMERVYEDAIQKQNNKSDSLSNENETLSQSEYKKHDSLKQKFPKSSYSINNDSSYIPKPVRKELIDNFEFPEICYDSQLNLSFLTNKLLIILIIPIFAFLIYSFKFTIIFLFGAICCIILLYNLNLLNIYTNKMCKLKRLKDIRMPAMPHITDKDRENYDLNASDYSNYSGWINMTKQYDLNAYNINQCITVHVDIESGSYLRFRRSRKRIHRHAVWNDTSIDEPGQFIGELLIDDLTQLNINLVPDGLVHKRLWSKKYPIELVLPKPIGEYQVDKAFKEIVDPKSTRLYLFGRTCRQKEEWFRRFSYEIKHNSVELDIWNIVTTYLTKQRSNSTDSNSTKSNSVLTKQFLGNSEEDKRKIVYNKSEEDIGEEGIVIDTKGKKKIPLVAEYVKYMSKFMPSDMFLMNSEVLDLDINYVSCSDDLLCVNAFMGRIFWDFMHGPYWKEVVKHKIECKLKKIHLPPFMDVLKMGDINLGQELPIVRKLARPYLDSRGLWIDAEISYCGEISMHLETKVNLFNLRNQAKRNFDNISESTNIVDGDPQRARSLGSIGSVSNKTAAFESDEEDSADSSTDNEDSGDENTPTATTSNQNQTQSSSSTTTAIPNLYTNNSHLTAQDQWSNYSQMIPPTNDNTIVHNTSEKHINTTTSTTTTTTTTTSNTTSSNPTSGSKKLVNFVNKLASSPYFQKVSDNKYIQRGMEFVSNTPLCLQVKLTQFTGTLALNIPPPPSDRLWYGFRANPEINLSAKPSVANKEISFPKVVHTIEQKLLSEFSKVLVLPNMDEIPLPLLVNGKIKSYLENL